jgi:hypothetical protein
MKLGDGCGPCFTCKCGFFGPGRYSTSHHMRPSAFRPASALIRLCPRAGNSLSGPSAASCSSSS